MNKKGTNAFFYFSLFVVFVILALALSPVLTETSSEAQGSNGLDCSNAVGYQDKANCTSTDAMPFLYFLGALGFAAALIKAVTQ